MKFLTPQITYLITQREHRGNLKALLKYLLFLTAIVAVFTTVFHGLMVYEGQDHSWLTGVYWTLTVMSTLGFGDITFQSDAGRLFSVLVLMSGIVLLLIVLPFAFIRFFYAPWLEAQIHLQAPRKVPESLTDHVIICSFDEVGQALVKKLRDLEIPYCVIEPDTARAAALHGDGISVVTGDIDRGETYEACRASNARLVVANLSDAVNCNVTLTVREIDPDVQIVAFAEELDSVDVLELSGATHVLTLRHQLGESLAARVTVGPAHAQVVGRFKDLVIAEFPIENTGLAGRTIRDTHLRELTGLNIVSCWERGHMVPAGPNTILNVHSVVVVVGTQDQISELDALFVIYRENEDPVLVIGGGKVGRATATALRRRQIPLHLIEKDPALLPLLTPIADRVIIGDASDREIMTAAGLEKAPSVVLTTNDDAMNIFLAVYCRRLNLEAHIVSRINHERNLDAIHRAGADSVLSFMTLGVRSLLASALEAHASFVGEGVDLSVEPVPKKLVGTRLADGHISEKTGLNVIALQHPDGRVESASADTVLVEGSELVMLGAPEQGEAFHKAFD
jgi:Trk K+ transport system NAD-binding subunit